MGRQPRSGDIPWLSAHSILNWIGGDSSMLVLFGGKSRGMCRFLQGPANTGPTRVSSPKLHRYGPRPHLFSFEGPAADQRSIWCRPSDRLMLDLPSTLALWGTVHEPTITTPGDGAVGR